MRTQDSNIIKSFVKEWRTLPVAQKWLYALYAVVLIPNITHVFYSVEYRIGLSFLQPITNGLLLAITIIGSLSVLSKHVRVIDFLFLFFLIAFHYISGITHPETATYHKDGFETFVLNALPLYLLGLSFTKKTSLNALVFLSFLAVVLEFLAFSSTGLGVTEEGEEREELMGASYSLLPFVILVFWNAFERGGLLNYIFAVFSSFLLMSLGTRGPVVCLFFFIAVYIIVFKAKSIGIWLKMLIGVTAVGLYWLSDYVILAFGFIAMRLGFSNRVFESMISNEMISVENSSGRDFLYANVIDYIKNNDLKWGNGLYSDRNITGFDSYVHNFELEILCDFGYIGGTIVLILFFLFIIRAFRNSWGTSLSVLLLVFFSSSVMHLQFSGSFLSTPIFYLFIGMCISSLRETNKYQLRALIV